MKYWREANGPNIAVDWVSSLPSKLETLARKLLIEPVIRIQLSVLQFVITHDNETRIQLATNPATLYAFMLSKFLLSVVIYKISAPYKRIPGFSSSIAGHKTVLPTSCFVESVNCPQRCD